MAGIQLYEAIVVDAAPDPALPGHLRVRIPELFDDVEVPILIPPMYPGWIGGGWHSVPGTVNPDDLQSQVRVLVARLGNLSFKWIGTTQTDAFIAENPGTRSGARSGDGKHRVYLDNSDGMNVQIQSNSGGNNVLNIAPNNDISLSNVQGAEVLISGTVTKIHGGTIELGGGTIPPTHAYILSLNFLADLSLVCSDIVATGAAIPLGNPYVAANATAMIAKITTSLSSGAPYLSTRIKGD